MPKKAKQAVRNVDAITNVDVLERLLLPYEKAAEQALEERKNVLGFLNTYQTS